MIKNIKYKFLSFIQLEATFQIICFSSEFQFVTRYDSISFVLISLYTNQWIRPQRPLRETPQLLILVLKVNKIVEGEGVSRSKFFQEGQGTIPHFIIRFPEHKRSFKLKENHVSQLQTDTQTPCYFYLRYWALFSVITNV